MRVLVATDAWRPQINGVVRSLEHLAQEAPGLGAELLFLTPDQYRSVPLPSYGEIRLSLVTPGMAARAMDRLAPTHVHVATEGPVGLAVRAACLRRGQPFTTSYHTRFPEYLSARLPMPERWSYAGLRRFHNAGRAVMASTPSLARELAARGFRNVVRWTRGVDTALFRPRSGAALGLPGPVFLFVGRLAVEKNVGAFLRLGLPGTKVVVGEGPARAALEAIDPTARFLGALTGEALAEVYAAADVFVFPSRTDTVGIVLLEALASGLPVAAFPVMGPADVIAGSVAGVLDEDLRRAALAALAIPRERCRAYGETYTWRESARQFLANVADAAGETEILARAA